jgi:LemA protein
MIIIIFIIVILITIYIFLYNRLISAKNYVEKNLATIETVFQNRYDLIPNLVEVVKQYTSHEEDVLTKITKIRSELLSMTEKIDKNRLEEE